MVFSSQQPEQTKATSKIGLMVATISSGHLLLCGKVIAIKSLRRLGVDKSGNLFSPFIPLLFLNQLSGTVQ